MNWLAPEIEVTIGDETRTASVQRMEVAAARSQPVASVYLELSNVRFEWNEGASDGDPLVLRWGYRGQDLHPLFDGTVLRAHLRETFKVWGLCRARALSDTRITRTYQDEAADAVVNHLVSGLGFAAASGSWRWPMRSRGDLATELKRLVEGLHPDLRPFFRPSLLGKVVAVDDDNYRVDVVVGGDEEAGEAGLALPDIPVASLFAQDGYGVWALPEVEAEVTVSFHDGDVTRPYVESPLFYNNQAPAGFTTGTIAIRGKQGQKIEMKPGTSEIVVSAGSLKLIATDKRQEHTAGDVVQIIKGSREGQVAGVEKLQADAWTVVVNRAARIETGSLSETTKGDLVQKVGGSLRQNVAGSVSHQVAGGASQSITFSKREVVGGGYEILVAATPGIGPAPPSPAYSVLVNLGNLALDSMGGQVDIGANILTPPLFVNIGSVASGPVQLGGLGASGQPAACGLPLQIILNTILTVLKTVPLGIGNLGAPIAPNPAVAGALAAADAAMAQLLSGKVFIAQV